MPWGIWNDRVPRGICEWPCATKNLKWFWSHDSILLTKFHLSSLKSKKVGGNGHCMLPVRSLCAPCAPPLHPLCNPCATLWESHCLTTVWPLCQGPFLNWFGILIHRIQGYWSTGSRDTDPQNQKWVWDTDPRPFFGHFAKVTFFFSGPVGRVPIKIFFAEGAKI